MRVHSRDLLQKIAGKWETCEKFQLFLARTANVKWECCQLFPTHAGFCCNRFVFIYTHAVVHIFIVVAVKRAPQVITDKIPVQFGRHCDIATLRWLIVVFAE